MFTTSRDDQTTVQLIVMQAASEAGDESTLLGDFQLEGLRRAPAGQVAIEVVFAINADGIVSVSAKDVESGLEQSISVRATSGLTDEERARMIEAGRRYAAQHDASAELATH
jgi:molecular chaperone DnaK